MPCVPRVPVVLADGTAYHPLAVCIEAGNEAACSPGGAFGPPREIRAFCWCAINPSSTGCVQQSLVLDARNGSRGRRQSHRHSPGSRDRGGGGGGDDGGGGGPEPRCNVCGLVRCQTPTLHALRAAKCWGCA